MPPKAINPSVFYREETRITVAAHVPRPRLKGAATEPIERKRRRNERAQASIDIGEAMDEWHIDIRSKAEALATQFGKSSQYFLALLYNKPTQVKATRETNMHNAWGVEVGSGKDLEYVQFSINFLFIV